MSLRSLNNSKASFEDPFLSTGKQEPTVPPIPTWYGDRGIWAGGATDSSPQLTEIDYFDITSTGNASDFGDLSYSSRGQQGNSNGSRAVIAGGYHDTPSGAYDNAIDYFAIATTGNGSDFGDLTESGQWPASTCNGTRGTWAGKDESNVNQYVTMDTTGNASDFGDLVSAVGTNAGCNNSTRGVIGGGNQVNVIQYITIANTGNATDFGDLTQARRNLGGLDSDPAGRGVFGGGCCNYDVIDYITIANTGNATDFGNLLASNENVRAVSDGSRGVFGGGNTPSRVDVMQYITIANTGNATDFGDLTAAKSSVGACSGSPS